MHHALKKYIGWLHAHGFTGKENSMKNYLKLVNDERQEMSVLANKACSTDTCPESRDHGGSGCLYVDVCNNVDFYHCTGSQYDVCDWDTCADCNSHIADA